MDVYSHFRLSLLFALFAALGTLACMSVRCYWIRRRITARYGCQPVARTLNREPFLGLDMIPGLLHAIRQHTLLERTCRYYRACGNTFKLKELQRRAILTIEPENIKTVLSLKFEDYGIHYRLDAFRPLLGEGIFDTDGDHWASSRALIRPSFVRDQVADLTTLEDLIQDLLLLLPRDGETTVDLMDLFFRYTIDSATEFLFGKSVGTLKKLIARSEDPDFAEAFHYAQKAILTRATLGFLNVFYRDHKAEECNRICREFAQRAIEEARHAVEAEKGNAEELVCGPARQKHVFAQELASRTTDKERILDESMNLLLAGRDTTASLLTNLFFMLAKNPEIWEKVRKEVAVLEGRPPTYEELRSFRYIHCCMNESLRLHPVVARNERMAVRDTVLPLGGGKDGLSPVLVTKGTVVSYSTYAMHRRRDLYGPDSEEFRPERWQDGKLQPRWGYLPFNGGPRICIGQRYALTEAGYVLVRIAQEFRNLESRNLAPWEESLALTLCSRDGAKVCLTPA